MFEDISFRLRKSILVPALPIMRSTISPCSTLAFHGIRALVRRTWHRTGRGDGIRGRGLWALARCEYPVVIVGAGLFLWGRPNTQDLLLRALATKTSGCTWASAAGEVGVHPHTLSRFARRLTGQTIYVDGGISIMA